VRRPSARRGAALALCLATAFTVAGCNASQLQFRNDHRLTFEAPKARAKVTAPVTISWSMKDFEPTALDGQRSTSSGVFAVFVDRAPMPVAKDLRWLTRNDRSCQRDPRCPDQQYLADEQVYVTADTSLTLDVLPRVADGVGDEQHYVNIVLLDGTGHRIGESAWYRPFTSKRRSV
jgi:hypothetical protein